MKLLFLFTVVEFTPRRTPFIHTLQGNMLNKLNTKWTKSSYVLHPIIMQM